MGPEQAAQVRIFLSCKTQGIVEHVARVLGHAADRLTDRLRFRAPFLIINPESHLTGTAVRQLALTADALAAEYDIDTVFAAQYADLRMVSESTSRLTVAAQHMDALRPGAGVGAIVPESVAGAGAGAVILNHHRRPLTLADLEATIGRARELGLLSIVCAGTDSQCRAVACLAPDVIIADPASEVAARAIRNDRVKRTVEFVKQIDSEILVAQAARASGPSDLVQVLDGGADGVVGTSFIVGSYDRRTVLTELFASLRDHRRQR